MKEREKEKAGMPRLANTDEGHQVFSLAPPSNAKYIGDKMNTNFEQENTGWLAKIRVRPSR